MAKPTGWGRLIEQARNAAGWSQAELADKAGLPPEAISRYEMEKVKITPDAFDKLTRALRSLVPADLATAMGYPVSVESSARISRPLAAALSRLDQEELDALTVLLERGWGGGRGRRGSAA